MLGTTLIPIARQSALNAIDRAEHLLGRVEGEAEPGALLAAQLVPGQFDCAAQLRTVTIFALRSTVTLLGRDWSLAARGADPAALRAQFEGARAEIAGLPEGPVVEVVRHQAGDAELAQSPRDYLLDFALPNLWFHLSMAYAILRREGLDVGKADFDGLHAYAPGFSFVK